MSAITLPASEQREAYRRAGRPGAVPLLFVLLLHALVLSIVAFSMRPRPTPPRAVERLSWLLNLPPPARSPPASPQRLADEAPRGETPRPPAAVLRPRDAPPAFVPRDAGGATRESEPQRAAVSTPAEPDASAPVATTSTPPSLLESEATRQALRELARQPLLSERAAAAGAGEHATSDEKLAKSIAETGKPDCLTGFSGAGLLAVPMILWSEARGSCSNK